MQPSFQCRFLLLILVILGLFPFAISQDAPYVIHDTQPLILEGPYLVAPSETGLTVVWITDTPCHSSVAFGIDEDLGKVVEMADHGLLKVGRLHSVRLTGLKPGTTYRYQVSSTRVVKLKPYWPEKGLTVKSPVYSFRTPDRQDSQVAFTFITDTQHEDLNRLSRHLEAINWNELDFLVHGGDALDWVVSEDQLFEKFLGPVTRPLNHEKFFVFVRGNHDMRGPFARELFQYLPTSTGKFYYALDAGPVHVLVIDSGEDKADSTAVYGDLNRMNRYREQELAWFKQHIDTSKRLREAPFRVLLIHSPTWGWVGEDQSKWTHLANLAGIDLLMAGHHHRFTRIAPGSQGNEYPILVVGQDQVANVAVTSEELRVTITDSKGEEIDSFALKSNE